MCVRSNIKVSVIMPVYNTEQYLEEAILSITNQTLTDIEIIIVNDGSTDTSPLIIEKIACNDSRVILINQTNCGSSIARQNALERAKGEYLYFMDSDDVFDCDALLNCYNRVKKDDLDMVIFDAISFTDHDGIELSQYDYNRKGFLDESCVYSGCEVAYILLENEKFRVAPWMHFFRKETVINASLQFYPNIVHEDELFFSLLYLYSKRVGYIAKDFFKRRLRPNSTMTTSFGLKNYYSYKIVIKELVKHKSTPEFTKVLDKLIISILNSFVFRVSNLNLRLRLDMVLFIISNRLVKYINFKFLIILLFPFIRRSKNK